MMMQRLLRAGMGGAALVASAAMIACGSGGGTSATATAQGVATAPPAATAAASPTAAAVTPTVAAPTVAAPTTAPAPAATPSSGGAATSLTVKAENISFDSSTLNAKAGPVTIEFENEDNGVVHNFHLFQGSDQSGPSVGMTPITSGPDTQKLNVTLAAGTYFYHCDVHPTQMSGTLTVS